MATLQQTLRGLPQADDQLTRGPGGSLQRTTLQQAAQKAGLGAAPTTPMGAQVIGADAQAAKMAGTPQQVKAALQQATETPTLETALRQKQYGRALTAQEAAGVQKSTDMQKLGGLGDRVQNLVTAEFGKLTALTPAEGATTPGVKIGTVSEYQGTKITPELATKLQQLQAATPGSENYNQLLIDINTAFGRTTADTALKGTELQSLYKTAADILGTGAAEAIIDPDKVKAMDFIPKLGYTAESLSALLGVPPADLQNYSLTDLQNKVSQVTSEEFTRTKQLQQQAISPLAGAAERGLAREAARELSTTGIRATEADMQRLAGEVSTANQVNFMGQTKSIDQWLANDEISAMVKEVVDSPADSQIRKDLRDNKETSDFYKFIERNEIALKAAADKLDTGSTQFKQLQDENKQTLKDTGFSDEFISKVAPKLTGLQLKKIDLSSVPTLSYVASVPKESRPTISKAMEFAVSNNYTTPEELNSLSPEQFDKLGIGKIGSNWDNFIKSSVDRQQFKSAGSPEEQLKFISDSGLSISDINSMLSSADKLTQAGIPISVNLGVLDVDGDGRPDWGKLNEAYNKINPPTTLKQAADKATLPVRQSISVPEVSKDTLISMPMNLEKARQIEQMQNLPGVKINPIITAIRESQEKTPETIDTEVFAPAVPQYRGKPIAINYSDRFVNLSKRGNFIDKDVLRDRASKFAIAYLNTPGWDAHAFNMYNNLQAAGLLNQEATNLFKSKALPVGYDPENKGNPLKWYSDEKGTGYR